jgi:hypothetical protein
MYDHNRKNSLLIILGTSMAVVGFVGIIWFTALLFAAFGVQMGGI